MDSPSRGKDKTSQAMVGNCSAVRHQDAPGLCRHQFKVGCRGIVQSLAQEVTAAERKQRGSHQQVPFPCISSSKHFLSTLACRFFFCYNDIKSNGVSLAHKKILNLNELEKQICESEGLSFGLWWKPNTTTVQNWMKLLPHHTGSAQK